MTATEELGEREKQAAEAIIATTQPFTGVENIRVELGEDHSGDPSMWLVFRLRHDLQADEDWVKSFSTYSTDLTLKLLQSGLTRFPYRRMERAA